MLVGGGPAEARDSFAVAETWLPFVTTFVLQLSLVLLTVAFRSIVIPLTAIAVNLLSVGAAYGILAHLPERRRERAARVRRGRADRVLGADLPVRRPVRALDGLPAMRVLGERNWYLPPWLGWLPNVQVEGASPGAPEAVASDAERPRALA